MGRVPLRGGRLRRADPLESVSQKITGRRKFRENAEGGGRNNLIRSMVLQIKWPGPVLGL